MRPLNSFFFLAAISASLLGTTWGELVYNGALTRAFAADVRDVTSEGLTPEESNVPGDSQKVVVHPEVEVRDDGLGGTWYDPDDSPVLGMLGGIDIDNFFGMLHDTMKGVMEMGRAGFGSPFFGFPLGGGGGFPRLRFPKPKTSLERVGSCRYLVSWAAGVSAENLRVIVRRRQRMVQVQYQLVTRHDVHKDKSVQHSFSKEQSSQSLSVDPECLMTDEVLGEKLAGWTDNSAQVAGGGAAAHRLLITFPSPGHIREQVNAGRLPEDTLARVENADFTGFTPLQRCLISGRTPEECKHAEDQVEEKEETPRQTTPETSVEDTFLLPCFTHHDGDL